MSKFFFSVERGRPGTRGHARGMGALPLAAGAARGRGTSKNEAGRAWQGAERSAASWASLANHVGQVEDGACAGGGQEAGRA